MQGPVAQSSRACGREHCLRSIPAFRVSMFFLLGSFDIVGVCKNYACVFGHCH